MGTIPICSCCVQAAGGTRLFKMNLTATSSPVRRHRAEVTNPYPPIPSSCPSWYALLKCRFSLCPGGKRGHVDWSLSGAGCGSFDGPASDEGPGMEGWMGIVVEMHDSDLWAVRAHRTLVVIGRRYEALGSTCRR